MSYEPFRAAINNPALVAVAEHWNAARADRPMPAWQDIDPAAIKAQLPIVWSWRWDAALGTFIGRLAGDEVVTVLGQNPRGKRIEECFPPDAVDVIRSSYRRVIDEPALMHSQGKVYRFARGEGWGERIALPLAADHAHADGVFGATVYRLGIRPTARDKVTVDHLNQAPIFFRLPRPRR